MILYLDGAAFLKLYVDAPETESIRRAVSTARVVTTQVMAYAEVRAGLAEAVRLGRIEAPRLAALKRGVDKDWAATETVRITEGLIQRAADLAEAYALGGCDGIHLAAAEAVYRVVIGSAEFGFLASNGALMVAAQELSIPLLMEH